MQETKSLVRTREVTIHGVNVNLYERTAFQQIALADYSESLNSSDESAFLLKSTCMLMQSLKYNAVELVEPSFWDKLINTEKNKQYNIDSEWNQMFVEDMRFNIVKELTAREIYRYCAMIQELEGSDSTNYRLLSDELKPDEVERLLKALMDKKKASSQ